MEATLLDTICSNLRSPEVALRDVFQPTGNAAGFARKNVAQPFEHALLFFSEAHDVEWLREVVPWLGRKRNAVLSGGNGNRFASWAGGGTMGTVGDHGGRDSFAETYYPQLVTAMNSSFCEIRVRIPGAQGHRDDGGQNSGKAAGSAAALPGTARGSGGAPAAPVKDTVLTKGDLFLRGGGQLLQEGACMTIHAAEYVCRCHEPSNFVRDVRKA